MTITRITGSLASTNPQAITKETSNRINSALNISSLSGAFKPNPAWNFGILVAKTRPEDDLTVDEFTQRLRELVHSSAVEELALEGTLIVKIDNKNHFKNEFRVRVDAGNVSFEEVKFSHLLSGHAEGALSHALYMTQRSTK